MKHHRTHDFHLSVSINDLVVYFGDGDEDVIIHPMLDTVFAALDIAVDFRALYLTYMDRTPIGAGDVHVFQTADLSPNRFAIDLYRELTDQQDIIQLAVTCSEPSIAMVRRCLRALFDRASQQIHLREGCICASAREMLNAARYPRLIAESGYLQNIHLSRAPSHAK